MTRHRAKGSNFPGIILRLLRRIFARGRSHRYNGKRHDRLRLKAGDLERLVNVADTYLDSHLEPFDYSDWLVNPNYTAEPISIHASDSESGLYTADDAVLLQVQPGVVVNLLSHYQFRGLFTRLSRGRNSIFKKLEALEVITRVR